MVPETSFGLERARCTYEKISKIVPEEQKPVTSLQMLVHNSIESENEENFRFPSTFRYILDKVPSRNTGNAWATELGTHGNRVVATSSAPMKWTSCNACDTQKGSIKSRVTFGYWLDYVELHVEFGRGLSQWNRHMSCD